MLTNEVLQKLKDEGKISLRKIIGALLIKCISKQDYTEIIEYLEFDNSVSDTTTYPDNKDREVIGMIPVYDIYSVYAIKEGKLNFLGYYSNDELIVDETDWNHLYKVSIEGEI